MGILGGLYGLLFSILALIISSKRKKTPVNVHEQLLQLGELKEKNIIQNRIRSKKREVTRQVQVVQSLLRLSKGYSIFYSCQKAELRQNKNRAFPSTENLPCFYLEATNIFTHLNGDDAHGHLVHRL